MPQGAQAAVKLTKEEIVELAGIGDIRAPFAGTLCAISVEIGDEIAAGAQVAVIEAMKMQTPIVSEVAGVVNAVSAKAGQMVQAGDRIIKIDLLDA